MKDDLLKITKARAQVLRAIAYQEYQSKKKGATEYDCVGKIPKPLRVPKTTFNDAVKYLEQNLFVMRLNEKMTGKRPSIPFTITTIGQIAWLRYFPDSDNIEIITQLFPNIQLSSIDMIFEQIDHQYMKYTNKFSTGVLKIALDSFHLEKSDVFQEYTKLVKERIELSADDGDLETSLSRWYSVADPVQFKKLSKNMTYYTKNFDELEISIIDRITFLFYYNLIQLVTDISFQMIFSKITPLDIVLDKMKMDKRIIELQNLSVKIDPEVKRNVEELQKAIVKKNKEILKIITSNETVSKIIQDNLKDISNHKNQSFQNISNMFIKTRYS
ncbi:hypothetical protein [Nitrosarchaeum sp.]|uniref:hypothetical protein n=1 Tax=Nitrosarchaeum sp. TaxID=2026886 RepID=UPI00247B5901|nr:hypothetical protein [Nitrosarchaeum sp.]MCV0411398.1 hypothetical protein [Nitrosarchaeum sp.]